MISVSYRLHDSEAPGDGRRAHVEVVCGLVVEHGVQSNDGGFNVWPPDNSDYPTAKRIGHVLRDGGKVYRRRIIVVEDWTEVDAP